MLFLFFDVLMMFSHLKYAADEGIDGNNLFVKSPFTTNSKGRCGAFKVGGRITVSSILIGLNVPFLRFGTNNQQVYLLKVCLDTSAEI